MKNFGEKEAWAYPGTAQIFGVPPIISGTGKSNFGEVREQEAWDCPIFWGTSTPYYLKLRISNLESTFSTSEQKPITNFREKERGCIQGLPNFFG